MNLRTASALICAFGLPTAGVAQAHFLWVLSKPYEKTPAACVYFSETASPDAPDLLDRVASAKAWVFGGRRGDEAKSLKLEKKGDALVGELSPEFVQSPVVLSHTYGVASRGGETFLLNYSAKNYPLALPGTWRAIKDAELLPLEICPSLRGSEMELRVLWQEEPLAGAAVTIEGPGIDKKLEGTTDERGMYRCNLPEGGLFSIRAKHVEDRAGEHDGQAYKSIRHYSTLALRFALPQVLSSAHSLPPLMRGVTSFGGAVIGDNLYVYGGQTGRAHEYSPDGQSGELFRLNLNEPRSWEQLPGGPRLTGLAMVAHGGRLYRVGGFAVKNAEGEEESLWSQADFARFDPQTAQWSPLPSMPAGRSSHDAAILGSTLYVVGGWNMQGKGETKWHDTALAIDLADGSGQWKPIAQPPFRRRALTLAAWHNKLYCLGGMQERGEPVTSVAVYDPASDSWSDGPALMGSGMDGFGSSAFACAGELFATTMSGSVQRLSGDGTHWEFVGQLQHPRFFHRLLPWHDDRLIVVGGASMASGKILALEILPVQRPKTAAR